MGKVFCILFSQVSEGIKWYPRVLGVVVVCEGIVGGGGGVGWYPRVSGVVVTGERLKGWGYQLSHSTS